MIDCKDYTKAIKRGSGILVYIPKSVLESAKINSKANLEIRRYPTVEKKIILLFKEV